MEAKKVILIPLTVLIIGPLLFVGACLPLAGFGFGLSFEGGGIDATFGTIFLFTGWAIGIILGLYVIIKLIKIIKNQNAHGFWRKVIKTILVLFGASILGILLVSGSIELFSDEAIGLLFGLIIIFILIIFSGILIFKIMNKKSEINAGIVS